MFTGFRLGRVLYTHREVGTDAVQFLENRPWTLGEQEFLELFAFMRIDPEIADREEKAWQNFLFWLKSVISEYCYQFIASSVYVSCI